ILLERALASFPPGTLHLAVVDPGVGTNRHVLIAEVAGQIVVCPDNGLITWSVRRLQLTASFELTWRPQETGKEMGTQVFFRPQRSSTTFHGRDVMAPAVGMLLQRRSISEIAKPLDEPVLLELQLAESWRQGQIIHIDAFGNATINLPETML